MSEYKKESKDQGTQTYYPYKKFFKQNSFSAREYYNLFDKKIKKVLMKECVGLQSIVTDIIFLMEVLMVAVRVLEHYKFMPAQKDSEGNLLSGGSYPARNVHTIKKILVGLARVGLRSLAKDAIYRNNQHLFQTIVYMHEAICEVIKNPREMSLGWKFGCFYVANIKPQFFQKGSVGLFEPWQIRTFMPCLESSNPYQKARILLYTPEKPVQWEVILVDEYLNRLDKEKLRPYNVKWLVPFDEILPPQDLQIDPPQRMVDDNSIEMEEDEKSEEEEIDVSRPAVHILDDSRNLFEVLANGNIMQPENQSLLFLNP